MGEIPIDVWITRCRRRAKCKYCEQTIHNGEFMVVTQTWIGRKKSEDSSSRRFRMRRYYHAINPYCWIDQGIQAVEKKPKIETRGRKSLAMSHEEQEARNKILRRRAAVVHRITLEVEKPVEKQRIDRIITLGGQLESLKEEITAYGGVPKSWE